MALFIWFLKSSSSLDKGLQKKRKTGCDYGCQENMKKAMWMQESHTTSHRAESSQGALLWLSNISKQETLNPILTYIWRNVYKL